MTPDRVARLVAEGENLAVEFKGEERSALNDRDLVETVVCLANRVGGGYPSGYGATLTAMTDTLYRMHRRAAHHEWRSSACPSPSSISTSASAG